jgi:23S rRNA pseudouridine2605 synthase
MQRVQKILSHNGVCSRRNAEKLIDEGRVRVNDKIITLGDKATDEDKIYVDNKLIQKKEKIYLKFHKPVGYVTALTDRHEKTIMELINIKERVFPVGRLDKNTSGLILLTNDGDFANKIMHPRYEIEKTYLVGLYRQIEDKHIKMLERGIELDDGKTRPAKVKKHHERLIEITIHEGKNRIIRRMLKKIGHPTNFLKRIKIGKMDLGKLEVGKIRFLTKKELDKFF